MPISGARTPSERSIVLPVLQQVGFSRRQGLVTSCPWRQFHPNGLLRFQYYSKQVSLVGKEWRCPLRRRHLSRRHLSRGQCKLMPTRLVSRLGRTHQAILRG